MKNRTKYILTTVTLLFLALVVYMFNRQPTYAAPRPIAVPSAVFQGTLFYTTFFQDGNGKNVFSVDFSYNSIIPSVSYTNDTGIIGTPGADGIIFDSNVAPPNDHKFLLIGGQAPHVYRVDRSPPPSFTTVDTPNDAYHLSILPDSSAFYTGGIPAPPNRVPLPWVPGPSGLNVTISGADLSLDSIAFPPGFAIPGDAYYTSSGATGNGFFGVLHFNSATSVTTTRVPTVPQPLLAAHGMVFDPFNSKLMLSGAGHVTQITPALLGSTVFSDFNAGPLGAVQLDQCSVDANGHVFAADNNGNILFVDYAATGMVATNSFANYQFLKVNLDDLAPLIGPSATPTSTPTATAIPTATATPTPTPTPTTTPPTVRCPTAFNSPFCNLGAFGKFAVLALDSPVCPSSVDFGTPSTTIQGDVGICAGVSGIIQKLTIDGDLVLDTTPPGTNVVIHNDVKFTDSHGIQNQDLSAACGAGGTGGDCRNASQCASALACTQNVGDLTTSTTFTGNGGLNVICINNVNLVNATITIQGGPSDTFIFNVTGPGVNGTHIFNNVKMSLVGVTPSQILWNFTALNTTVSTTKIPTTLAGTFLVPNGSFFLDKDSLAGSICAGCVVRIHSGATLSCPDQD